MTDQPIPRLAHLDREPSIRTHRIGRWTFDTRGDELADLRYAGVAVVRAVRFVVRDQDWRTIPIASTELLDTPHAGSGQLRLRVKMAGGGVRYSATLEVTDDGTRQGHLRVRAVGTAESSFFRNRIGLVVLHHPDDAGSWADVTSAEGFVTRSRFPIAISPHQPFHDIASFSWVRAGVEMRIDFAGDVFEMEDQRNWSDASFKTYSTPLSLPFPVEVSAGDVVSNQLDMVVTPVEHDSAEFAQEARSTLEVNQLAIQKPLPKLSTLIDGACDPAQVKTLGLAELTAELDTRISGWRDELVAVVRVAELAEAELDLRLVVAGPLPLEVIGKLRNPVVRVGVFDAADHLTRPAWQEALANVLPAGVELLSGTRAHFTELNRSRDRLDLTCGSVVFSTTPQMHATEVRPIIETVGMLPLIADAVHELAGESPIRVGPVTVEPRFNAVATSAASPVDPIADHSDLNAHSALPIWLFASVIGFAHPGIVSLCIGRGVGVGALLAGESNDATALTPAGRVMAFLAGIDEPITAVGRSADTLAVAFGEHLVVADLSGRAEIKRLVIDGRAVDVSLPAWGITS